MGLSEIAALKASIRAIEHDGVGHRASVSFASEATDRALGKALACGRVHEITGPMATAFAVLVLARTAGPILWCALERSVCVLYPPGLAQVGLNPDRLVLMRLDAADDLLRAAHEGLRAGWQVAFEPAGPLDLGLARRLQLAAQAGGGLGLAVAAERSGHEVPLLASATTRWLASAAEGGLWPAPLRLNLRLVRNSYGRPGQWCVEWDHAARRLDLVSADFDRQDRAPQRTVA